MNIIEVIEWQYAVETAAEEARDSADAEAEDFFMLWWSVLNGARLAAAPVG